MFFIGQWVWNTQGQFWEPPNSNLLVSAIDLRPLSACAAAGGTPQGYGLFEYSSNPNNPDLTLLGNTLNDSVSVIQRNVIEDRVGVARGTMTATTLLDLYWEVLTDIADSANIRMCPPIMPTKSGRLELHLSNHSLVKSRPFEYENDSLWPKILEILKKDYLEIRDFSIKGNGRLNGQSDPTLHLRYLGELCSKYKCSPSIIHPTDIPIPPSTTLTESFNQTDSTTLGPDQTWTEFPSDLWETVSNQAQPITSTLTNCTARVDSDLSGSDQQVQADVTWKHNTGSEQGCCASRFSSTEQTCYWGGGRADNDLDIIGKVVAGTFSSLTNQSHTIINETLQVVHKADGSTISVNVGAFGELSTTDTSITSGVRCGLRGITNTASSKLCSYDVWQGEDLAGVTHQGAIDYTLNLDITKTASVTYAGAIDYTNNLDVTQNGTITYAGAIDYINDLDITLTQSLTLGGSLDLTNDLDITLTANVTLGGILTLTNNLDVTQNGTISYAGAINYTNDLDITLDGTLVGTTIQGNIDYTNDLDITQNGSLTLGGVLTLTNNLDITQNGSLTLGGFLDLTNDLDTILIASTKYAGSIDYTNNLDLIASGIMNYAGSIDYTNNLDLTTNGSLTLNGVLDLTHDLDTSFTPGIIRSAAIDLTHTLDTIFAGSMKYSGTIDFINDLDITLDGSVAGQVSGNVDYTHSFDVTFNGSLLLPGSIDTTLDVDLALSPKLTLGGTVGYTEDQTASWFGSMKRGGQLPLTLDNNLTLNGSVKLGATLPFTVDLDITLTGKITGQNYKGVLELLTFSPFHPFGSH